MSLGVLFIHLEIEMKRLRKILFLSFIGALASGCAVNSAPKSDYVLAEIHDIATGGLQELPSIISNEGVPTILYSSKAGRVVVQAGERRHLLDEKARVRGGNHFQLHQIEGKLHAFWWSHADGKNVYITSSDDGGKQFGKVEMVNDDHGILPPFTVTNAPNGIIGVTYHDERNPNFSAYFNRSIDGGHTWPRPDIRLDSPPADKRSSNVHEPQTVEIGRIWVSIWTDSSPVDGKATYRIITRRTDDAGKTWTPTETIYASDHHISALKVRAVGSELVVAADELSIGVFGLTSKDNGNTWHRVGTVANTAKTSNSGIQLAVSNGRAHLVWMKQDSDAKTQIMRASMDIQRGQWLGAAKRLDTKLTDNTKSLSPDVLVTPTGLVLAAWVDYRDIRSNIYLSTSRDTGVSWTEPQPLLRPGTTATGWPRLMPWQDSAAIAYEIYPTDVLSEGRMVLRELPSNNQGNLVGMPQSVSVTEEYRHARLKQRIETLWNARIAADYPTAYDIFDFAYKAATPKAHYLANVGVITYLSHSTIDTTISGNVATANMKLQYEVKPTFIPGVPKPISVPKVDVETPTTWVWVGDDWYLVFSPSYDRPVLQY